jgi:hypothetical protein
LGWGVWCGSAAAWWNRWPEQWSSRSLGEAIENFEITKF